MAVAQRPRIGASAAVYAILDETTDTIGGGTPTWGTIYTLPNVMKVSVNPNGSGTTLFGDDKAAISAETTGDIDITLDLADLMPADEGRLLGHTYAGGSLAKAGTDQSPYVAFGFKMLRTGKDGANLVYDYVWLYKGKFQKPSIDEETKGATIKFQPISLKGKFVAMLNNGQYANVLRTDDANATSTTVTNFFNQVSVQSLDLTALTATIAKGTAGDSGKIVITFSKGSGSSFSLNSNTITSSSIAIMDATSVRAGTFAVGSAGTTVAVKFTPTVAFSGAEVIGTYVDNTNLDNSNVAATPIGKTLTF